MHTLTHPEQREITNRRIKRLFEYDFWSDDIQMEYPQKAKEFIEVLGMYDWAMGMKFILNVQVIFIFVLSNL